jgi:ketosteroid isomerase-like protein
MKADTKTEQAVTTAIHAFADAYRRRDLPALTALVSPDPDVILVGTGADETRIGVSAIQKQAERDWDQTDAASMHLVPGVVSAAGHVAWVACEGHFLIVAGGAEARVPIRLTAVFEKRGDRWLAAQMHVSTPMAEQAEGQSFPSP